LPSSPARWVTSAWRPPREKDIDEFREKKRPKVTAQVPCARSDTEVPSELAAKEAVGDELAGDGRAPVAFGKCFSS
jgi:hypothetical protein